MGLQLGRGTLASAGHLHQEESLRACAPAPKKGTCLTPKRSKKGECIHCHSDAALHLENQGPTHLSSSSSSEEEAATCPGP